MVEFGLKLEDNKVVEWSEYYIQYEKLKQILKRWSAANHRLEELSKKDPARMRLVMDRYRNGLLSTPGSSVENLSLHDITPQQSAEGKSDNAQQPQPQPQQENTLTRRWMMVPVVEGPLESIEEKYEPLGSAAIDESEGEATLSDGQYSDYGSTRSSPQSSQLTASSHLARVLERATTEVTEYWKRSFDRQVRDCLSEMEKDSGEFDENLTGDLERANSFYQEKLKELQERLSFLKDTVAQSRIAIFPDNAPPPPPPPQTPLSNAKPGNTSSDTDTDRDDDNQETPLINSKARRRTPTPIQIARKWVTQTFAPDTPRGTPRGEHGHHGARPSMASLQFDWDLMSSTRSIDLDEQKRMKEALSIQRALVDLYRSAKLLHNFAIMNYTGFIKIVKKHDKTIKDAKGRYKKLTSPSNICNEGRDVEALAARMERLYANWFCERNISEAQAQMLPKQGDGLQMDWSQLRLGYRMGMCSMLCLWVCWDCIWGLVSDGRTTIGGRTAFPVFRACAGLVLLQWFWGCSVWVWSRYRVNYIYIMDLDPSIVHSPIAIFNEAVDHSLVFLVMMLLYYKAGVHGLPGHFPAGVFPFILVLYMLLRLIFPLRTRIPMWHAIWLVVTAPMNPPTFFHSYIGDIFTSMIKVFQDMLWAFFFVLSGDWLISEDLPASTRHDWAKTTAYSKILIPLITLLPLWIRFNQCLRRYADTGKRFPHVANAFKYALSQTVTLFGAFHPLYMHASSKEVNLFQAFWTLAFVASSLYSFSWDVLVDWGLGRPDHAFLGPRLMYPHRQVYYLIIVVDLVLRFAWVLTLVPPQSGAKFGLPAYLTAVSMMLELFRRTLWGFLRLENEHRTNTAGFRRVGFVPLHFATGHTHDYNKDEEHRGVSVLVEIAIVTALVLAAAIVSVAAAQHATERSNGLAPDD